MNWDDLRYVLALTKAGSLAKAARALKVDHTTVGRRIDAIEADLGLRLFTRTTAGYVPTQEAERLMPEIEQVEAAVLRLERATAARGLGLEGTVRVTSPETFGGAYLAPRLAVFRQANPALTIELLTGSAVFDLARQEADVAVRFFRSKQDHLVLSRAGAFSSSFYGTEAYFARRGFPEGPADLAEHEVLWADSQPQDLELQWLKRVAPGARIAFVSNLTFGILAATLEGAGLGFLPRYLGDVEPRLRRAPMPDEPRATIWLTVHRDLRRTRRVREVLDFLRATLEADAQLLSGDAAPPGKARPSRR